MAYKLALIAVNFYACGVPIFGGLVALSLVKKRWQQRCSFGIVIVCSAMLAFIVPFIAVYG